MVGGPDDDAEISFGGFFHQLARGEGEVKRDLVGTGFLGEVEQMLILADDVHYLWSKQGGRADGWAEFLDVRDRRELEAFYDDLREEF